MKPIDELKRQGDDGRGIQTNQAESYSSIQTAGESNDKSMEEAATTTDYALSLLRGFRNGRGNSNKAEVGSNGSNGSSDTNSGLVSFGNNSFLFQFDGEEGGLTNGSFPTSESDNKNGGTDSDGEGRDSRSSGDGPRIDPPASGGSAATADSASELVSHSAARTVTSSSRTNSSHTKDPGSLESMSGLVRVKGSSDSNSLSLVVNGPPVTRDKRISHPSTKSSISSLTMSSHNNVRLPSKSAVQKSIITRDGSSAKPFQPHRDDDAVVTGAMHLKSVLGSYRLDQQNGMMISFLS